MKRIDVLLAGVTASALLGVPGQALAGDALSCKADRYLASGPVRAALGRDAVDLAWYGADGAPMAMRLGVTGGKPTIERLSVNGQVIGENLGIEYKVTTGLRRMSNQQMAPLRQLGVEITDQEIEDHKWDAFWDSPLDLRKPSPPRPGFGGNPPPAQAVASQPGLPRDPKEIAHTVATYAADGCTVVSEGERLSVSFPKMSAGVFAGDLVITVFNGTNLIKTDFIARTQGKSVAYKYNAGITGLATGPASAVLWKDTGKEDQAYSLKGMANDDIVPLFAANRLVVGRTAGGSIAAFPPPHTFFWAREHEDNPGNNWYRKDGDKTFSIGIRQPEMETVEEYFANWALYSAPPGSEQRMSVYFYPVAEGADKAFAGALAFTSNDRYPKLPGYKVMANHFHTNLDERLLASGNMNLRLPDFEVLRSAGVEIAGLADRPRSRENGPTRLETIHAMFEGAERNSDDTFMVMPNFENSQYLGGHWDLLVSGRLYWEEGRKDGEPIVRDDPKYGRVYKVGNADEVMQMVERENLLVYMPHPRTKGSTHYPDAVKDDKPFNTDRYRGVGWRWGMGSDLSERRLSEKRVLPLFDDMNNWIAGTSQKPKYLLAITETYEKQPGDDVYANGPVNYVKLDVLPTGSNYAPIIKALNDGDYFVSTGEVLIPNHGVSGSGRNAVLTADVRWTFPLDFVEVSWGDGKATKSKVVEAKDLPVFGSKTFAIPFDARGAKWVRFGAWDTAGNGAMTQPVRVTGR